MKRNLYLYLFLFAALIALILYVNGRNIQQSQDDAYRKLESKLEQTQQQLKQVNKQQSEAILFSLKNNEEAYNYFNATGIDVYQVESILYNHLLDNNVTEGGNPYVDYIGQGRGFQINDIQVLNHKWLIANFTDNHQWGEVLMSYSFDDNKQPQIKVIETVLYDKYH